jgi:hypothetical protein
LNMSFRACVTLIVSMTVVLQDVHINVRFYSYCFDLALRTCVKNHCSEIGAETR